MASACNSLCSSSSTFRGLPPQHSLTSPSANSSVSSRRPARREGSGNGNRNQYWVGCRASQNVVKQLGKALWGRGLPPGALVEVARQLWGTGWQIMMGQLAPSKNEGEYDRPQSQFRARPQRSGNPGDFHLYAATTCPWAHRALIVHSLKGLEDAVPVSIVVPGTSGLWEFSQEAAKSSDGDGKVLGTKDRANGKARLLDAYKERKGGYEGRATVPMLWDQSQREVVNNESADIIEILNSDFNDFASNPGLDLAPSALRADIDRWNGVIYTNINNGVYRCGFAQSQEAYEIAVNDLFATLDSLETHLASSRYLCGDSLTLADIRLFTTLYRFDPVYNILFKCSKQKLSEYSNLPGYLRDIYQLLRACGRRPHDFNKCCITKSVTTSGKEQVESQRRRVSALWDDLISVTSPQMENVIPGVASTCDLEAIMDGYYRVLFPLNPGSISPAIPRSSQPASLLWPHNREALSEVAARAGSELQIW